MKARVQKVPTLLGHNATITLADQIVSALSNFLVFVAIARTGSPDAVGAVALAIVFFAAVTNGLRTLLFGSALPIAARSGEIVRVYAFSLRGAVLVSCVVTGVTGVLAVSTSSISTEILTVAAFLPVLVVVDGLRYVAFAKDKPSVALLGDTLWLVGTLVIFLPPLDALAPATKLLVWCLAGSLAFVPLAWSHVVRPTLARFIRFRPPLKPCYEVISLGWRLTADYALFAIVPLGSAVVASEVLDAEAAAIVRSVFTLMGPVNIVFAAMTVYFVPRIARAMSSDELRTALSPLLLSVATCAVLIPTLLVSAPEEFFRTLFGETGQILAMHRWAIGWIALGTLLEITASLVLKGLTAGRAILAARLVSVSTLGVLALLWMQRSERDLGTFLGHVALYYICSAAVWFAVAARTVARCFAQYAVTEARRNDEDPADGLDAIPLGDGKQ